MTNTICAVFVCDKAYFSKFQFTCHNLRNNGKYAGDILLIIGDDLLNHELDKNEFIISHNVIIKHFPDIHFNPEFYKVQQGLDRPIHFNVKKFQYHKMHLFNTYLKQWNYILYIDCGMYIYENIEPILNTRKPNILLANRDGIDYENGTRLEKIYNPDDKSGLKLKHQFVYSHPSYDELENTFNLNDHCFQTTIMYYDTNIIQNDTYDNLINLALKYPVARTNEQAYMSLYFTKIKSHWQQLPRHNNDIYLYDLVRCVRDKYIMVKYPQTLCELDNGYHNIPYTGQTIT